MAEQQQEKKTSEIISVSVPIEMKVYLDKHTKINRSKLFQDAVNGLRYPQPRKISPAIMMMCFMGIVGGIVISMLAGFMYNLFSLNTEQSELWWLFPIGLLFLGLALSFGSFLTIMRARKDTKILMKREVDASGL